MHRIDAVVARRDGDRWRLFGQKFFCSNIGCEVALTLARPEGAPPGTRGLALFLVPRDVPDGVRNRYRIDRLKDKLGTRAMATGEVTLEGAQAELVGGEDRGFAQMTAMLNITRLHNAITAAATMRRALMLATAYAGERVAFGRRLEQHPLHAQMLREIAAEADGALYLTMRMAQLLGRIETGTADTGEAALFRVGIALAKLYTAKQAVAVASEALECFGVRGRGGRARGPPSGVLPGPILDGRLPRSGWDRGHAARYRAAAAVTTRTACTISSTAIHSSVAWACRTSPGP